MMRALMFLTGFGLLTMAASEGLATPLTPLDETVELMLEAQGITNTVLGTLATPLEPAVLNYTSIVNSAGRNFSYALVPGSSFEGQPVTLSTAGSFNASSNQWEMSSSMTWGATTWSGSGTDTISGDPNTGCDWNFSFNIPGFGPLASSCVTHIMPTGLGTLISSGTLSITVGSLTVRASDRDVWQGGPGGGGWVWASMALPDRSSKVPFRVDSDGFVPLSGGAGSFTTQLQPVPEPTNARVVASGLLCLILVAVVRRQFSSPSRL